MSPAPVAGDAAGTPLVALHGLTVRYARGVRPALDDLTLRITRGELVGVVGLNGAGKTTLALCLNGVVPQLVRAELAGTLSVGGLDPTSTPVSEMARRVGLVQDDPEAGLSQATVAEEVALGLEALGEPPEVMDVRVGAALASVGLGGLEQRPPRSLSGGEQQRLAIACAVAMRPALLVLDEPTSHLDPAGKAAVLGLLVRLNHDEGMTVVVMEHDVEVLAEHADRIVALDAGRVALDGTPAEVFTALARGWVPGLRAPQVTDVAAALAGPDGTLPVTIEEAVTWFGARP